MKNERDIGMVKNICPMGLQVLDFNYWIKRPPLARIEALEQIRQEYHIWRYGAEPRFQRVYTIIKR
jgi:hypothetical protein